MIRARRIPNYIFQNKNKGKSFSSNSNGVPPLSKHSTSSPSNVKVHQSSSSRALKYAIYGSSILVLAILYSTYTKKLREDEEFRKFNETTYPLSYLYPYLVQIQKEKKEEVSPHAVLLTAEEEKEILEKEALVQELKKEIEEIQQGESNYLMDVQKSSDETHGNEVAAVEGQTEVRKELSEKEEIELIQEGHSSFLMGAVEEAVNDAVIAISNAAGSESGVSTEPSSSLISSSSETLTQQHNEHGDSIDDTDDHKLPLVSSESMIKKLHSDALALTLEDHTQQSIALRNEMEKTLLKDIHVLDKDELKVRLVQLAAELYERTKWEGLRLHQNLKQVEYELSNKYNELLKNQRLELESEMAKKMATAEQKYLQETTLKIQEYIVQSENQLSKILKQQNENHEATLLKELNQQHEKLKLDFETEFNNQIALLKNEFVQSKLTMEDEMLKLTSQLVAYETIMNEMEKLKIQSNLTHQESAVLLALETALNTPHKNFEHELQAVEKYYSSISSEYDFNHDSKLIQSLIATLPKNGSVTFVIPPSIPDLKYRFQVVRSEIRKVALTPPAIGNQLVGQTIGNILAYISRPPEGLLKGDGTEEVLSRTNYFLEKGLLSQAIQEMYKMKGTYSEILASDWIKLAEQRLVIDQVVKVMRANNVLNHLAMTNNTMNNSNTTTTSSKVSSITE